MRTPVADWFTRTFPDAVAKGLALHLEAPRGWITTFRYHTGEVGIVLTTMHPPPMGLSGTNSFFTRVWGGPLHGEAVSSQWGHDQHAIWFWRVAHCEQTRPEYFAPPRKRRRNW